MDLSGVGKVGQEQEKGKKLKTSHSVAQKEEMTFKDFVNQIQKGPIKEVLAKDADMGDYIDDFAKSDAPQFNGKSKEKRKEMAIAAYYAKNES